MPTYGVGMRMIYYPYATECANYITQVGKATNNIACSRVREGVASGGKYSRGYYPPIACFTRATLGGLQL